LQQGYLTVSFIVVTHFTVNIYQNNVCFKVNFGLEFFTVFYKIQFFRQMLIFCDSLLLSSYHVIRLQGASFHAYI